MSANRRARGGMVSAIAGRGAQQTQRPGLAIPTAPQVPQGPRGGRTNQGQNQQGQGAAPGRHQHQKNHQAQHGQQQEQQAHQTHQQSNIRSQQHFKQKKWRNRQQPQQQNNNTLSGRIQKRPPRGPAAVNSTPPKRRPRIQSQERPQKPPDPPKVGVVYTTEPVFKQIGQVGEGTYGRVYKAVNQTTGLMVAMKRLRLESEREGFPITAAREIKLLQSIQHPNVVRLYEMVVSHGGRHIYMLFEYIDHDLSGLLQNPELILLPAHIKSIVHQLLEGMAYLHHKAIVHRDIKGPNILVDCRGQVKLADFGLARTVALDSPDTQYTNRVITLWYRPPELLLGATRYGAEVDMWGVGCLLVEMFLRRALFPGKDEVGQLKEIYSIMGTPRDWTQRGDLPWFWLMPEPRGGQPSIFKDVFYGLDITRSCFTLAESLLAMNPAQRISAADALKSPYFAELPNPENLRLAGGEWHDFEAKERRRKRRAAEAETAEPAKRRA